MKKKYLWLGGLLILLGFSGWYALPVSSPTYLSNDEKQKGVCWVGGRELVTGKEIDALVSNHITWISQTPFGWQARPDEPEIHINTGSERTWWGESDNGIKETVRLARERNIKTFLKPHLWVRNGWPGDINMTSSSDWEKWFTNYSSFILHYAALAEENKIEIFCMGTELHQTVVKEAEWRDLIRKIRQVYHGKLTYAANFHEEYEAVKFWDALDFIGIQAYFSLSNKNDPTTQELITNWKTPLSKLELVQKKFNKPVIFTEIGYRSTCDAAVEPWKWPQEYADANACTATQANCYQAFFQTVWKKEWLAGAYFWKWYPHGPHRLGEVDFTPQGKPAEKVLFENFKKL